LKHPIFNCILKKQGRGMRTGLFDSGWGTVVACCEHGNEPSGSIKSGEFLEYLHNY
jgi:hypothetical protein